MAKLGKALLSLLLDKKARAALEAQAAAPRPQSPPVPIKASPTPQPHPSPEEIYSRLDQAQQASVQRAASPDRRQLIQEALKVRANKAKMLEDLPDGQQRKLKALAMMSLLKARSGQ
ncbi:MAG TPA: hypothetical protein VIN57_03020 [Magnetovibrio sp.]